MWVYEFFIVKKKLVNENRNIKLKINIYVINIVEY